MDKKKKTKSKKKIHHHGEPRHETNLKTRHKPLNNHFTSEEEEEQEQYEDPPATDHQHPTRHSSSFSLDLESRCIRHFEFLQVLHEAGVTQHVTSESLRRYLLWLNFLAKVHEEEEVGSSTTTSTNNRQLVIPPMDVAWLWHCHRLAPQKYKTFLQETFGSGAIECTTTTGAARTLSSTNAILELKDPADDPYAVESNSFSRDQWAKYNPNEPFDLDQVREGQAIEEAASEGGGNAEMICGFDLLASAKSQAEFYWQIQPFFQEGYGNNKAGGATIPTFNVKSAIKNYRRFLKLFRKHHGKNKKSAGALNKLVPTYEIDLMWHTHMTGGSMFQYQSDCEGICGRLIDHDDSYGDGDRAEEGVLNRAFLRTAELWSQAYHDDTYEQQGGYRGAPPVDYFPKTGTGGCCVHPVGGTSSHDTSATNDRDDAALAAQNAIINSAAASSSSIRAKLLKCCSSPTKKVFGIGISIYVLAAIVLASTGSSVGCYMLVTPFPVAFIIWSFVKSFRQCRDDCRRGRFLNSGGGCGGGGGGCGGGGCDGGGCGGG